MLRSLRTKYFLFFSIVKDFHKNQHLASTQYSSVPRGRPSNSREIGNISHYVPTNAYNSLYDSNQMKKAPTSTSNRGEMDGNQLKMNK